MQTFYKTSNICLNLRIETTCNHSMNFVYAVHQIHVFHEIQLAHAFPLEKGLGWST